ncbi:glycosyltransferase family 2 protein [Plantactinospora sp. WMMB782]|uniref:glycosyltransferase family 2 protein n=3 Tax=Plantactinospora sp. WMMB782 TaxID=3404121 RepID=UPI003B94B695
MTGTRTGISGTASGPLTVSVVVPCYNAARTLRACLRSVLAQTYRPVEVLLVDDGSTDESREIAAELGCRVLRQPENRGVSAARNAGVAATRGEVVFFLDSDVALAPDALGNAVDILATNPAVGAVHGTYDTEPLIDDGPVERYRILHAVHWRRRHVGEVRTVIFALAALRRDVLRAVGPLHEGLRDCEDVEYSSRLARHTRVVLTGSVVGRHDDGSRLWPILTEQWRRAVPLVPLALAAGRTDGVRLERANHPLGVLAAALLLGSLPLAVLAPLTPAFAGWLAALPAVLALAFCVADPALPRFVYAQRGLRFTAYFLGVHLLVHLVLVAGMAVGALRWLVRPRHLARPAPATVSGRA